VLFRQSVELRGGNLIVAGGDKKVGDGRLTGQQSERAK
jgi:hypothetical protein